MNTEVPFLDLITPHREREDELVEVVRDALRTGRFIGGPMVEDFEREFAQFCTTRFCVGVGSGTDALRFGLQAAGVQKGDLVLTVPFTFIATTEAITQVGARPVFVDIHPLTYTMDPEKVQHFIETTCRIDDDAGRPVHVQTGCPVTALVPVHLYGQMADMSALAEIAERYHLIMIEDACQAHGAACYSQQHKQWKTAGSLGKAAAFSFYPGKNLGACGEGGAVTTDDEEVALTVRRLRDHGQMQKYIHTLEGYNGRLDAIQAGMLRIKLRQLGEWNERRRRVADRYTALLGELRGLVLPHVPAWAKAVYHLYVIRLRNRDRLQAFLAERNIGTGLHYPVPLHLQQAYAGMDHKPGDFPVAERASREVLSLPLFPGLTEDQQGAVVDAILKFDLQAEQPDAALDHPGVQAAA
jgi:dTDP-4-amino-4,6-dideoxygalactose transaminase